MSSKILKGNYPAKNIGKRAISLLDKLQVAPMVNIEALKAVYREARAARIKAEASLKNINI